MISKSNVVLSLFLRHPWLCMNWLGKWVKIVMTCYGGQQLDWLINIYMKKLIGIMINAVICKCNALICICLGWTSCWCLYIMFFVYILCSLWRVFTLTSFQTPNHWVLEWKTKVIPDFSLNISLLPELPGIHKLSSKQVMRMLQLIW